MITFPQALCVILIFMMGNATGFMLFKMLITWTIEHDPLEFFRMLARKNNLVSKAIQVVGHELMERSLGRIPP